MRIKVSLLLRREQVYSLHGNLIYPQQSFGFCTGLAGQINTLYEEEHLKVMFTILA